jgi:general stress protein 26
MELKDKILKVMKDYPVGSVATIKDGKPWVRYMATQPEEDLTIFSTSFAGARKIGQIKDNNNIHVTFGADPKNWTMPYINVEGTAEILTDLETKKKCWQDMLGKFFQGPEDPNYVVVKIKPQTIEYIGEDAHEPQIYLL